MNAPADTAGRRLVLVAAVADNGVIGDGGDIPWRIPEDMRHFRRVTEGHPVVMGRLTYESIGRPLPRRTNIVITGNPEWTAEGVTVVSSLEAALEAAQEAALEAAQEAALEAAQEGVGDGGEVMVIGGAQVYAAALPLADAQVLTEVHATPPGDTHYPPFDRAGWEETRRERHDGFDFVWLERRRAGRVVS